MYDIDFSDILGKMKADFDRYFTPHDYCIIYDEEICKHCFLFFDDDFYYNNRKTSIRDVESKYKNFKHYFVIGWDVMHEYQEKRQPIYRYSAATYTQQPEDLSGLGLLTQSVFAQFKTNKYTPDANNTGLAA